MKNKNKLLIAVMILLVLSLVSVSFVIAGPLDALKNLQGKTSGSIIVIIANTAMIFAGVFAIFSLIKKGMETKQTQIIQIVMAVFSLIIAIELNKTYPGMFLWKINYFANLFHAPVIVNTIIIGAGLALLAEILLEKQLTPQLKWAIRILVVIMALNFAMEPFEGGKTWDDVKDSYEYIWKQPFLTRTRFYLFGAKDCVDELGDSGCYTEADIAQALGEAYEGSGSSDYRYGILTPKRLLIFVLLFFVIVAAFKSFVKTELFGDKFIYALSFLLSSNLVNNGTTIGIAVFIGQVVLSIVLYRSMKDQVKSKTAKFFVMILSISLVEFIARSIFKDRARTLLSPVVGGLGTQIAQIFGDGFQAADILSLLYLPFKLLASHPREVGIFMLVLFMLGVIAVSKGKGDIAKRLAQMAPFLGPMAANFFLRKPWRAIASFLKLGKWASVRRKAKGAEEDAWPYVFLENRPMLQVLQHYHKRVEIYYGYWKQVKQNQEYMQTKVDPETKEYRNFDILKEQLIHYRSAAKNKETGETTTEWLDMYSKNPEKLEPIGWNAQNITVIQLINESTNLVQEALALGKEIYEKSTTDPARISKIKKEIDKKAEQLQKRFNNINGLVETPKKEYDKRLTVYGWHNFIKRIRLAVLDQCNVSGAGNHTYLMTSPDTKIFDPSNPLKGPKPLGETKEVDYDGNLIEDINNGVENPRKVIKEDMLKIKHHPNYLQVVNWEWRDWYRFIEDMRKGLLHSFSRTATDYVGAIEKNIFKDSKIKKTHVVSDTDFAMDLRALKDPGRFKHAGRTSYNSKGHLNHGDVCVTTQGMVRYFVALADKDTQQAELLAQRLSLYPADLGGGDPLRIMGLLSEAKKEGQK